MGNKFSNIRENFIVLDPLRLGKVLNYQPSWSCCLSCKVKMVSYLSAYHLFLHIPYEIQWAAQQSKKKGSKGKGWALLFKNAYACVNKTDLNVSAESNCAEYLDFPTSSLRSISARTGVIWDGCQKSYGVQQRCCWCTWFRLPRRWEILLPFRHWGSFDPKARKWVATFQNITVDSLCDTSVTKIWRYWEQSLNGYQQNLLCLSCTFTFSTFLADLHLLA